MITKDYEHVMFTKGCVNQKKNRAQSLKYEYATFTKEKCEPQETKKARSLSVNKQRSP